MCGKDPRDKAGAGDLALVGEVAAVEAERRGAPQVAPPGGERLRAGGVLDGEQGDDLAENGVREAADAIAAAEASAASFLAGAERRRRLPLRLACRFGMGRLRRHLQAVAAGSAGGGWRACDRLRVLPLGGLHSPLLGAASQRHHLILRRELLAVAGGGRRAAIIPGG